VVLCPQEFKLNRSGVVLILSLDFYVGGDSLTSEYKLSSLNSYSSTSRIRSKRSLNIAETPLHAFWVSTTSLKFNSKLDVTEGDPSTLSELNMDSFLRSVADIIEHFGLENFFYLPDSDKNMKYFPEGPHNFTLSSVLAEHQSRLVEPECVDDANGTETTASVTARFRCYDDYKLCDFSLS